MATTTLQAKATARSTHRSRLVAHWGLACYVLVTGAVLGLIVVWLRGGFAYVVDDPAIHLAMAKTLVEDQTWGVAAGSFQSASSSPLWTVLVALGVAVAPVGDQLVPLALNVVAGIGVVFLFTRSRHAVLRPSSDPVDLAAIATVIVAALFLPGLAIVGMEHSLQMLLVVGAVVLVQHSRWDEAPLAGRAKALVLGLLALAALTRFETAFVAVGLAVGLATTGWSWRTAGPARRFPVEILAAVGGPIAAFSVGNRAMGGGWLPNSVLSKAQGVGASNLDSDQTGLFDMLGRLTQDPLLVGLVCFALAYLVFAGAVLPGRYRLTAVTLVVAATLHAAFADVGWFERYQAYLVGIGIYLVLGFVGELPAEVRRRSLVALSLVVLLLASPKLRKLSTAHHGSDDMYRHQYQAGKFLDRFYDGEPVATDQLGYIAYFHDGPITDIGGLGDYEVLSNYWDSREERQALLRRLVHERGFEIVVLYDSVAATSPSEWTLVGSFVLDGEPLSAVTKSLQFWATTAEAVAPMREHLEEFEDDLPAHMEMTINKWADFQAAADAERPTEPAPGS